MILIATLILFGLISLLVIISAYLSPIPRKIGFRNVKRRLGNTLLVVIGSMVGTALISGSLVLSDSLDKTFLKLVESQVGEIDLIIEPEQKAPQAYPFAYLTESESKQLVEKLGINEIDGVLPLLGFIVSPYKIDSQNQPVINSYQVELYAGSFDDVKTFGTNPQNLEYPSSPNGIIVSQTIADSLELNSGDKIVANILGNEITMTVDKIYPDAGILGGKRIVIPYEYMQKELNIADPIYNYFLVSADGGLEPVDYKGEEFDNLVKEKVSELDFAEVNLYTTELKQLALDGFGLKFFVTMFIALSLFGIFSGVLLIVNLYAMLASERQMEMGILRAIALTRTKLTQTFIYEGYVYSIVSSLLGTFVGLILGYFLIYGIKDMFASVFELGGGNGFEIVFDATPKSLLTGFLIGSLITILSSAYTSFRISKLNIVSAIRNLDEEKVIRFNFKWIISTLVYIALFLSGLVTLITTFGIADALQAERDKGGTNNYFAELSQKDFTDIVDVIEGYLFYAGVVFTTIFGVVLISRVSQAFFKKNINWFLYTFTSLGLIIFTALMGEFDYLVKAAQQDEGVGIIFLSGIVLVISLSLVVSYNLTILTGILSIILSPFKKIKPAVKMALRYPAEDHSRTGLTLVMFAVIIFLIAFISIEKAAVNDQSSKALQKALAGYDAVIGPSTFGPEYNKLGELKEVIRNTEGVEGVDSSTSLLITMPEYTYADLPDSPYFGNPDDLPSFKEEDTFKTFLSVVSDNFLENNQLEFKEFSSEYSSEDEVWQAIKNDPSKVVLGKAFTTEGFGPIPQLSLGDTIQIGDIYAQKSVSKQVIGFIQGVQGSNGIGVGEYIIVTEDTVLNDFGQEYLAANSSTVLLAKINDSYDTKEVVNEIKKNIISYNIYFVFDIEELVGAIINFINSFLALFQGFLAFSLVVGASGLAIIVVRSVNERRQQIGMLRSLGFQRGMILFSFFIEATFITLTSIVIGISMGIVGTNAVFQIAQEQNPELEIIIPWSEIMIISLFVYISSLMFALLPSIKAARLSPVEATNYPE